MLKQALSDIEAACCAVGHPGDHRVSKAKEILASIKNTMSDRHIVEKNFNELLEVYRDEVLPDVIERWNGLTSDQQASLSKMNNFFCGLHFLVALADAAAATLQNWESLHSDEDDCSSGSGTVRLIRTACKAVQKQCSQQAGCHECLGLISRPKELQNFQLRSLKATDSILCSTVRLVSTIFATTLSDI